MSVFLSHITRYAVRKLATDPQAKAAAARAARAVADQARQIARREDKAQAAGQALRRALNRLQGDR